MKTWKTAYEGPAEYAEFIGDVLCDDRGWKQYGHLFAWSAKPDFTIKFVSSEYIRARFNSGLSLYHPASKTIFINELNWNGGSQISIENNMTLEDYRVYVINHEVGHALGYGHTQSCPASLSGKPGPVMMQMSRGQSWIHPCKPNSWPLPKTVHDESAIKLNHSVAAGVVSQMEKTNVVVWVMFIVLCCVTCLFYNHIVSTEYTS